MFQSVFHWFQPHLNWTNILTIYCPHLKLSQPDSGSCQFSPLRTFHQLFSSINLIQQFSNKFLELLSFSQKINLFLLMLQKWRWRRRISSNFSKCYSFRYSFLISTMEKTKTTTLKIRPFLILQKYLFEFCSLKYKSLSILMSDSWITCYFERILI